MQIRQAADEFLSAFDAVAQTCCGSIERTLRMWVWLLAFTTIMFAAIAAWGMYQLHKEQAVTQFWHQMATKGYVSLGRGK